MPKLQLRDWLLLTWIVLVPLSVAVNYALSERGRKWWNRGVIALFLTLAAAYTIEDGIGSVALLVAISVTCLFLLQRLARIDLGTQIRIGGRAGARVQGQQSQAIGWRILRLMTLVTGGALLVVGLLFLFVGGLQLVTQGQMQDSVRTYPATLPGRRESAALLLVGLLLGGGGVGLWVWADRSPKLGSPMGVTDDGGSPTDSGPKP
jgi:hypothetical protein